MSPPRGRRPGPLGIQEPTLSELEMNPPPFIEVNYKLRRSSPMDLDKMSVFEFERFCISRLGQYENQVYESAAKHQIPPQLLATIILNELADIDRTDQFQESWLDYGSLGIAQIEIGTAIKYQLIPGQLDCRPGTPQTGNKANPHVVANRLRIPQFSIDGAARYIRILLERMCANTDKPWLKGRGFNLTDVGAITPQGIYSYVHGPNEREKEASLAQLIAAAYNNEDIIIAQKYESVDTNLANSRQCLYWQAIVHGNNAMTIARHLYDLGLFH